jgi:hypothetical protein
MLETKKMDLKQLSGFDIFVFLDNHNIDTAVFFWITSLTVWICIRYFSKEKWRDWDYYTKSFEIACIIVFTTTSFMIFNKIKFLLNFNFH